MSSQYIDLPLDGSGGGGGVSSLNTLTGAVNLVAGLNVTITPSGNNLTISSSVSGTAASGDLTGTYPGPFVATVGGSTAANIHTAEQLANAATNLNMASTIVKRDASGNFVAGTITATLNGTATNISATSNSTLTTLSSLSLPGSQVTGNISGNAANITGVAAIANGGTGQSTRQAALNTLAGAVTSGYYLRGDGTNVSMSAIQVADVPTLNQNTSGTAANITASSNSTLTTLSALSLPGSQVTGNIPGNAANITATSNSTLTTLSALSLPGSQVTGNISGNAANITGVAAIANGGTGQTTAKAARGPSGLNIDERTTVSNVNYTILSTDRYVGQIGTLSAVRTFTLPAANSLNAGQVLIIADESGSASSTNYILVSPAGTDTINNSGTGTKIRTPYGRAYLISDGTSNWTDTIIGISRGGTGLQTLPADGQLLIGDSSTSTYDLATLTAGTGINITNGHGSIQITNTSPGVGTLNVGLIGDGVDGAAVISGNTTLARDMYYSSLTINSGVTLNPGGFSIFVDGVLTNNGTISRAGNNGGNSGGATAGGAGGAVAGTTVGTASAGAAGGAGGTGNGASGVTSGAVSGEGGTGGVGGNGGGGNGGATSGGSGGNSGVVTPRYFRNVQANWKYTAVGTFMPTGAGGAGGAAGGGDGVNSGRGGGGGGSAGPCIFIVCDTLVNNGTISAPGGNGGNGGAGALGNVGGGAGGGGGGGGKIMILANTITTRGTLTAPGGNAGNGSAGAGTGVAGTAGGAGSAGFCTTFEANSGTWTTNNS